MYTKPTFSLVNLAVESNSCGSSSGGCGVAFNNKLNPAQSSATAFALPCALVGMPTTPVVS